MASKHTSAPTARGGRWRPAFLSALAEVGVVSYAAKAARIDRNTAYNERLRNPEFADAWKEALDAATDRLEEEAVRRARTGVEEPVFGRIARDTDGEIGRITRYSDRLLEFLLRGNRPSKYRQTTELTGPGGGPLELIHDASDRLLDRLAALQPTDVDGSAESDS